jgi:hypothetical protein
MWNTRYFILPLYPHGWRDPFRGYASFLHQTEPIHPDADALRRAGGAETLNRWIQVQDAQVRRNLHDFPRAWVVHEARWVNSAAGSAPLARGRALQEMIYGDDPIWHDPSRRAYDPRRFAWVDQDKKLDLLSFLSGRPASPAETVQVSYPTPQRTELEVSLESPGLVVLADVYYPGWELTIDGRPAPIYPVNRLMRGAALAAGTHHLVYSYAPQSFRLGRVVSILGLGLLALLGAVVAVRTEDAELTG